MNLREVSSHLSSSWQVARSSKILILTVSILVIISLAIPNLYGFGQVQNQDNVPPGGSNNFTDINLDDWDLLTNQIIVKYWDTDPEIRINAASPKEVNRLSTVTGVTLTYVREMSGDAHVYRVPSKMDAVALARIIQKLSALPEVAYSEPDQIMRHTATPNDPLYPQQWHYFAPTSGNYGINLPPAWDLPGGLPSIVVAVIDTGITSHTEFLGRTVPGYDFVHDMLVANDGNGRDNNPSDPGDWITSLENASGYFKGCPVSNSSWHGTHVAGTIAAASNNGIGVAGINWNAKILPVRVLGKCGGYLSDISDGMRWAAGLSVSGVPNNANPAKVLNLSLGGKSPCSTTYQSAINAINAVGASIVVSVGNSNENASGFQPANCNGVITVAATNRAGNKAGYSNYGTIIDISAPGGDSSNGILSTLNSGTKQPVGDTYGFYQGTSMAAPHVSGVVSFLYAVNNSLHWNQVLQIIHDTVTPFPDGSSCNTSICGSGILNAYLALQAVMPTYPPSAPTGVSASDGAFTDKVRVTWGGSGSSDYKIFLPLILAGGSGPTPEAPYFQVYRNTTNSSAGATKLIDHHPSHSYDDTSAVPGTTYYYWVKACNSAGCSGFSASDSGYRAIEVTKPSPPTGISASDGNYTDKVQVSWTASADATTYQVFRHTSNTSSAASELTGNHPASPYNDTSAVAGTTYYYWVKACNSSGCSGFSASDSGYRATEVTKPSPPADISASDGTYTDKVQVSWTASAGATTYQVFRYTSNNSSSATQLAESTSSPYYDTSAVAGTTYYYWVKACNSAGCSGFSASDSGYRATEVTKPSPPADISASDGTYTDKVQVS
jgi:serine protease